MRLRRQEGCVWMWQNSLGSWPVPCSSLHCWWAWDADTGGIWHAAPSPHFNECTASTVSRLNESRGKREHIWKWILDFRSKCFCPRTAQGAEGSGDCLVPYSSPPPFTPVSTPKLMHTAWMIKRGERQPTIMPMTLWVRVRRTKWHDSH